MRIQTRRPSFIQNQAGSVSILFAIGVAVVGGLLMFQLASMFNMVNHLHARQKTSLELTQEMHRLGVLLKHSYDLGQMFPGCTGIPATNPKDPPLKLNKLTINGATLCLGDKKVLCVLSSDESEKGCVSLQPNMLNWKYQEKGKGSSSKSLTKLSDMSEAGSSKLSKGPSPGGGGGSAVKNAITIPPRSSTAPDSLWRSCSTSVCMRLVLCPNGKTTCTIDEAAAVQVVRFGNLE